MIAGGQQTLAARIPQDECEHAAQVLQQTVAISVVQPDDDFAVAVGYEAVAGRLQLLADCDIVVDFAVADEPDSPFGVAQRLTAACQIDDRKPPVTERHICVAVHTLAIRAPVGEGLQHSAQVAPIGVESAENAHYAAHTTSTLGSMVTRRPGGPPQKPIGGQAASQGILDTAAIACSKTIRAAPLRSRVAAVYSARYEKEMGKSQVAGCDCG
jgi:hypothetical protein